MHTNQDTFLQFAINIGALRFGDFVLKSGRRSPYFFNTGQFNTGLKIAQLGFAYAQAIITSGIKFDMLYGPAYKGIPLVIATSIALSEHYQMDIPYAFNRKEIKDHGEGGNIVGNSIQGKVLVLDDVISAGTSVRESVNLIRTCNAEPAGVVIALDRQEQDANLLPLTPIISILKFADVIDYLLTQPNMVADLQRMKEYQSQYI